MNHALMLNGWEVVDIKVIGDTQEATATYSSLLEDCPKCGSNRHGQSQTGRVTLTNCHASKLESTIS